MSSFAFGYTAGRFAVPCIALGAIMLLAVLAPSVLSVLAMVGAAVLGYCMGVQIVRFFAVRRNARRASRTTARLLRLSKEG